MSKAFEALRTDRLVLRAATVDDVGALFPITSDPKTWRHAPDGRHRDEQRTRDWLATAADRWAEEGLSYWIVRLREGGRTVGVGGVQRQKAGNWNLYYRFAPSAWGHGYAIELGRAALAAAHAKDDSVAVIAWVREHHSSSRRVDPSDGKARLAFADRDLEAP